MRSGAEAVERVLARVLEGRAGGDPVSEHLEAVRTAFVAPAEEGVRAAHLEAMACVWAEEPVAARPPRPPRRRIRLASRAGALAGGLALVATTALAATGSLPAPAQDALSNAARPVGISLPRGSDRAAEGKARAEANKARADEFTTAKKAWTRCVSAAAPAHEGEGPFDPEAACGPKPRPEQAQGSPGGRAEPTEEDGDGASGPLEHPHGGPPGQDPEGPGRRMGQSEPEGEQARPGGHGPGGGAGRPSDPGPPARD